MELVPNGTLITASPEEGRAPALNTARLVGRATRPDDDMRTRLRPEYAENPDSLVAVAHGVAVEFATVAAANDYWR
ncbi:hexameric tyrosine-coordinated heme protein [Streptomyces sp. NPDC057580]|uniref:hexameric tyrosine-coordinated heme protein n=1 Tax=Streptomyces sp. NPDC057580 TaxID=3346173 RepID=UPI0036A07F62